MSASHLSSVWNMKEPRGRHRLAMLALADCANHAGICQASVRTVADMMGEGKSTTAKIIDDLRSLGFIRLVSPSRGTIPARYQIVAVGDSDPASTVEDDQPEGQACDYWQADTKAAYVAPNLPSDLTFRPAGKPVKITVTDALLEGSGPFNPPETHQKPTEIPPAPGPAPVTQADVDSVLAAAGVQAPADQPFYWSRREHKADLADLMRAHRCDSVATLCQRLKDGREDGRRLDYSPRRISDLAALVGKGAR